MVIEPGSAEPLTSTLTGQPRGADAGSIKSVEFVSLTVADTERRLKASVSELAEQHPELSAVNVLTRSQRNGFILLIALVVGGSFVSLVGTGIVLVAAAATFYAAGITNRVLLFWHSSHRDHIETVSDEDALAVADHELPTYSILVPAYHEPELIASLLANLARLDYPRERLDIKILLEADDNETIDAIVRAKVLDPVQVVLVPAAEPRTKPKALNFGFSLCDADIITIYDVEDQPEPLQLRRAAVALSRLGDEVACVQAKLSYENVHQNLITKWFTLEYAMWFSLLLPGLVASGAPLPLGGTSNHFRRSALEAVGGWDPYNVTEDADLGIRLHRHHYSVKILDSVTLEEANSDFVNWVKQRSRWYKGYLQTFLIHLRQPRRFRSEVGAKGLVQFVMFVGATPLLALINPIFWTMTIIWFVGHPHFIKAIFPAPVFYVSILCWSLGNFAITYLTLLTARCERRYDLLWAALLVPLYWIMMSVAAAKAVLQLVSTPSFWEKTVHGLNVDETTGIDNTVDDSASILTEGSRLVPVESGTDSSNDSRTTNVDLRGRPPQLVSEPDRVAAQDRAGPNMADSQQSALAGHNTVDLSSMSNVDLVDVADLLPPPPVPRTRPGENGRSTPPSSSVTEFAQGLLDESDHDVQPPLFHSRPRAPDSIGTEQES
jgi:cellulose synthase/poly-beta-1,6-N-acetylglucosamine synthase-like glycosyltransferase